MQKEELAMARGYHVIDGVVYGIRGTPLKGWMDKHGYRVFRIGHREADVSVHRMVAFQKFGKKLYETGIEVRHLNGNQADNSDSNIAIGTKKQNADDKLIKEPGVHQRIGRLGASFLRKLTEEEVARLRKMRRSGAKYSELIEEFSIAKSTVSYIVNNKTYFGVAD